MGHHKLKSFSVASWTTNHVQRQPINYKLFIATHLTKVFYIEYTINSQKTLIKQPNIKHGHGTKLFLKRKTTNS